MSGPQMLIEVDGMKSNVEQVFSHEIKHLQEYVDRLSKNKMLFVLSLKACSLFIFKSAGTEALQEFPLALKYTICSLPSISEISIFAENSKLQFVPLKCSGRMPIITSVFPDNLVF